MKPPSGLKAAGNGLWKSVVGGLAEGWILDEREAAILELACHQADVVAALETAAAKSGAMTKGAAGQPVLNPAVAEARQGRLAIGKLLGQLSLPTEDEEPTTATAKRAQKAATARWNRRANTTQQRRKKNG